MLKTLTMKKYLIIFLSVLITIVIGGLSGILSGSGMSNWYQELEKPFFNPPSWVFGPAWTLLYTLMGVSFGLVITNKSGYTRIVKLGIIAYSFQLLLNFIWSPIFFYFQSPLFALFVILLLIFAIILTMYYFFQISKVSYYLLYPYLIWVIFASILNLSIVLMN